ncbi:TolC family protein [Pseudodesulfovibrio sp.]|uniref:TolC family protein n=1 Tax=Pseudodesulfovibrio sp. TaxID=2035812 RepID=UPI00261F17A8|nr:TolC family protein [Pseudodesulfovibrio sp.]MDD3312891.1 TolC family protein [Pseudodesulfovibrio sp.]
MRLSRAVLLLCLLAVPALFSAASAQEVPDKPAAGPAAGADAKTVRMSMGDVVSLTLRNNLSVRTSYLDRVMEKFDLEQADVKFEPTVNIDGTVNLEAVNRNRRVSGHAKSGTESTQEATLNTTVEQNIPTGATLTFGWENTYANDASTDLGYSSATGRMTRSNTRSDGVASTLSAELSQPLLKGAGIDYNTASVRIAHIQEERNVLNLRDTLSALINEGVNYFFTFVQAKENLDIQRQALDRSRRLLEINRFKMSLGRMSRSDVTQAEADEASQELSLEQAINYYDEARRNLLNHLDMDPDLQIEPAMEGYRELHPEMDECLAVARRRNQTYLDKIFDVDVAEINYMMAENERQWDVSVKAGAGRTNGKDNPGRAYTDTETHVGVTLDAPVNLWGADYMDRKQALLSAATGRRKAKVALQKAETDLQTNVANTVRNVNMRLKFIGLAKRNTELQKEQLDNENAKLMAGRTTNFQVVTYQGQLVSAQQAEVASIISYLQALLELDQLLGTTMKTWKVEFRPDDTRLEKELNDEVRPLVWSWW